MKTNNRITTLFIVSLLLFSSGVGAQEKTLTLTECREMALDKNKRIDIANHGIEKSGLTKQAYLTNYLPKLSAYGMGYYGNSTSDIFIKTGIPDVDLGFSLKLNNTYMAGISVEQPIYMGGKITSAYKMSKIGEEIAGLNRKLTEAEVILETDKAFWMCVQATELQKSVVKHHETVNEFHRVVKNAVNAGMKSKNDLMKVQVQVNQSELQLSRSENAVKLARMNLCRILGLPLHSNISLSDSFTGQQPGLNAYSGIHARPEYAMLSKQIDLKAQEKQLIKSDFLPSVGIRGSYSYINGIKLNNEKLFDNASFSALLSVSVPLFNWGEGVKKVRAAEIDRKIMELQRDEMSEKMELELQQAINAYNEALLEVKLTETALAEAEENLKMSRDYYLAGMETISDYLEAQTICQHADAEHIVAKAKLEISKTEWLKAGGGL
ncbi:TolC family protein [Bacteroides sp. OttesenSCG-928-D19]|nr:TolC family protein [Bacteroides sp. OttesenSCG-928-N06]MDL2305886.1 TolC family protein [Bacteroides sp. OttesenSCG-928-D19]